MSIEKLKFEEIGLSNRLFEIQNKIKHEQTKHLNCKICHDMKEILEEDIWVPCRFCQKEYYVNKIV